MCRSTAPATTRTTDRRRRAADDMEQLTIAPRRPAPAVAREVRPRPAQRQRRRPAAWPRRIACPSGTGSSSALLPEHCACMTLVAHPARPSVPPPALARHRAPRAPPAGGAARRAALAARAAPTATTIDLDAWVRHRGRCASVRHAQRTAACSRRRVRGERSLATLLLADLSLSTDAYVNNDARVIDVIRDALLRVRRSAAGTGEPFEMLGFSSVRRQHVRIQHLKGFDEPWNAAVRGRVGAIKPGYYTRMGAAIRAGHAAAGRAPRAPAPAADPDRRQAQRPRRLRGPLRPGGHAPCGAGRARRRPDPVLHHHRRRGPRLPAASVRPPAAGHRYGDRLSCRRGSRRCMGGSTR